MRTGANCFDCGVDTLTSGEFYMVRDAVWEEAWAGPEILCVGCLEKRLGRTLVAADFTDAPINDPGRYPYSENIFSARLRDRLRK